MNAHIVAVDTTADFGSIALMKGDQTIEEVHMHSTDGFAHLIFQQMEQLLARHEMPLNRIDCFAAASGPGSFTGVRVGLSAVKGLADAMSKPVVAVSNLKAIASFGTQMLRAVVMDARRGEVFGAVYDDAGNVVMEEQVMKFGDWLQQLPRGPLEFISPAPALFAHMLKDVTILESPRALASAIGRIAAREFADGKAVDPLTIDANYVRRSDAELFWKET